MKSLTLNHPPIKPLIRYNQLIKDILMDNPWGCTNYTSEGIILGGVKEISSVIEGSIIYTDKYGVRINETIISKPDSTSFSTA